MINKESKLKVFIKKNGLSAKHFRFESSVHSVKETLNTTKIELSEIVKTIIFKSEKGEVVAGVVPAAFRVSSSKLKKAVGADELTLATKDEAYELTGYPAGGMPAFGYKAVFAMDTKVVENDFVYTGGGSEISLTKISTKELINLTNPVIKKIRGNKSN